MANMIYKRYSIYDILSPPNGIPFQQISPPIVYNINIGQYPYSVVRLQGNIYRESEFLKRQLTMGNFPILFDPLCNGNPVSKKLADSLFLIIAYSYSEFSKLNIEEILCMFEIAQEFQLPINYNLLLEYASKNINNAEQLFILTNSVHNSLDFFEKKQIINPYQPLASPNFILPTEDNFIIESLGKSANSILIKNQQDQINTFINVSLALLLSQSTTHDTLIKDIDWRVQLIRSLGTFIAIDKKLPTTLVAGYLQNMSWDILKIISNILADTTNNNYIPDSLNQILIMLADRNTPQINSIFEEYKSKVIQMFKDINQAVSDTISSKLSNCFIQWLKKVKTIKRLEITIASDGINITLPYLSWSDEHGITFYGPINQVNHLGEHLFESRSFPELENILQQAKIITLDIGNLSSCDNVEALKAIEYPYVLYGNILPYSLINQFGSCIVKTDFSKIIERATTNHLVANTIMNSC